MKIQLERSGGFTGIPSRSSIDTDLLAPEERKALLDLVQAAHFFELPAKIPALTSGPDRFNYKLSIESSGQSHAVEFNEASTPPQLAPLIKQVTSLGRSAPKG
jgi:hypothetical protein